MINEGYAICFNEWALDKRIKSELNLLLIISSLTAENGFCYASNDYLAKLFEIDEVSVSRKLKKLAECGYIAIEYEMRGSQVTNRKLRLTKMLTVDLQKSQRTVNKNVKEKNTSIKNTSKEKEIYKEKEEKFENIILKEPLEKWLAYKKEKKQKYTPTGLKECIRKLERLSGNDPVIAMQIVEESMSNGWTGLFPLKDNKKAEPVISGKELYKQWFGNLEKGRENEVRESI